MRAFALNGSKDCIVCSGKIKDFNALIDFRMEFFRILKEWEFAKDRVLFLVLERCFPLENSFFGFLLNLVEQEGYTIKIITSDFRVFKSFEELRLDKVFDVLVKEVL
ncbi:hypothetical protein LW135_06840 [Helicobacter sp. faydin-H20]|uniref:hypothetical protein n=1 Tax=Helicobacter anatolicus TaxID=2905874 RepID=UPI001E538693|nr:hypothetical protein [Helicobacter anatolicus]MCE3037536.1 hypothetical protein [Helicobacter anatolicus]